MDSAIELAERLAERLCHDFAGSGQGLISGLDLLSEAASANEREGALDFLRQTLVAQGDKIAYARRAFGRATPAEAGQLRGMIEKRFEGGRAKLVWALGPEGFAAQAARLLLLLAEIGAEAAAAGGTVRLMTDRQGVAAEISGTKVGLRTEARAGLRGEPLGEGLAGRWIGGAFLSLAARAAGGHVTLEEGSEALTIRVSLPAGG